MPRMSFRLNAEYLEMADTGLPIRVCKKDDAYVCIYVYGDKNRVVWGFAIPKSWTPDTKSWSHDGFKYQVVGELLTNTVLGSTTGHLWMIECKFATPNNAEQTVQYLYSPVRGLLGFVLGEQTVSEHHGPMTYLLRGTVGFGRIR